MDNTTNDLVLVVDDSEILRSLVKSVLHKEYEVIEAEDGEEGFALALERKPDLIVTDLMMPEMDGYNMVRAIRDTDGINHIPIIMLTSVDTELNQIEGYRIGIDAYLIKPFANQEMKVRVANLITNRKLTKEHVNRMHKLNGAEFDSMSMDNEFIHKLDRLIEKHISNPQLKVQDLADSMGFSQSTFERRLKGLYGTTPKLYIRDYRLTRAMQLLKQRRGSVSDIARKCGFDNNSYFSVCFREKYNVTPSEMLGSAMPKLK